jgi:lysozyme
MDIEALKDQLILHEGLKLKPYKCTAGKITIGVGRNIEDIGITEDEARSLLDNDILRVAQELDNALPWWRDLSDVRQRVLLDMAFNIGTPTLMKFKNTLALIEAGEFEKASVEMLDSRWAEQVGQRARTLSQAMATDVLDI